MRDTYRIDHGAIDGAPLERPLSPPLQEHEADSAQLRVRGLFLVSGFAFGVLVGEVFFGGPFPAALVGLAAGMLVEFLSSRS